MYFKQVPLGPMANFSYIIGCPETKVAAVVDPAFEPERLLALAQEDGYEIGYIFTTHKHSDHTSGHRKMARATGAKVVVHEADAAALRDHSIPVHIEVVHGQIIQVGKIDVRVLHTPGHTPGGICLLVGGGKLLTGDTLFVGDCGRTDLPEGSAEDLFRSIQERLKSLDDDVEVFPGHDYGPSPTSTIGSEKETNPTMRAESLEEFERIP